MDLKINLKSALLPALLTLILLGGCSAQLATFGLATFGDDRSRENTISDNEIILDINKRLLSERNRDLFFSVFVDAYEGRVMLTGVVSSEGKKRRAGRLVNGLTKVRTLYNNIKVAKNDNIKNRANDAWIDAKIRAQLLSKKDIKWLNYRWRVVNGMVYLLGRTNRSSEKAVILKIIRQTSRVRGIIEHIELG